jgi:hypothetical protein
VTTRLTTVEITAKVTDVSLLRMTTGEVVSPNMIMIFYFRDPNGRWTHVEPRVTGCIIDDPSVDAVIENYPGEGYPAWIQEFITTHLSMIQ